MSATVEARGAALEAINRHVPQLVADRVASRITGGDATLWGEAAEAEASIRLGWTQAVSVSRPLVAEIAELRGQLHERGVDRIVLCGMGGSSLAPEVITRTAGVPLVVLDSTDPDQVASAVDQHLERTAVVVSSKSGSTVETDSQKRAFETAFRASGIDPTERIIIVTDPGSPQLVRNGGPAAIQTLVRGLGKETRSSQPLVSTLSKGMTLIAKPAGLQVPPWQMVSALLGGVSLRVASWWAAPEIPSTAAGTLPQCWAASLGTPGAVQIATSGTWNGESIGLQGGDGKIFNHAKLGVALDPGQPLSIFADMNQQGSLNGAASEKAPCACSQNGRGGLFYVLHDAALHTSLSQLLNGDSAPLASP